MHSQWCANQGVFNGARLISVFVSHLISILPEFVIITVYLLYSLYIFLHETWENPHLSSKDFLVCPQRKPYP